MTEIAANTGLAAREGDTPAAASAAIPRGRPIAVYLVLFGLAVALPALLFSAYLLYRFEDISRATIPKDFAGNPRIHVCWRVTAGEPAQSA